MVQWYTCTEYCGYTTMDRQQLSSTHGVNSNFDVPPMESSTMGTFVILLSCANVALTYLQNKWTHGGTITSN